MCIVIHGCEMGLQRVVQLPNVDPASGTRDAAVPYKVLLTFRKDKDPEYKGIPCFGCNAVLGGEGTIRVGDRISVTKWASP